MRAIFACIIAASLVGCAGWGTLSQDDLLSEETMSRIKAAKSRNEITPEQREKFGILADFVGRTFRGEPTQSSAESVADVQLWLWSDDGEDLIIKHRLEDGSYGGDSIVTHDASSGKLAYVYNTNAGFSTHGDFTLSDEGTWEAIEEVTGDSEITKVRSRGHIRADGALISKSEYFKNGEWVPGNSFVYREVWQDLPELKTPVRP